VTDSVERDVRFLRIREWKGKKLNGSQWRRISAIVRAKKKKKMKNCSSNSIVWLHFLKARITVAGYWTACPQTRDKMKDLDVSTIIVAYNIK
jgi:hypothetical protein